LDLWQQIVGEHTGIPCSSAEIDRFLASAAAYLLEERVPSGQRVFRPFHRALTDHLRLVSSPDLVESTFSRVLQERVLTAGGWLNADWYTRAHAATHVAGAGALDELMSDPAFLLIVDPPALLRAAALLRTGAALEATSSYRAFAPRRMGAPNIDAALLDLVATARGDSQLAAALRQLALAVPYRTRFAHSLAATGQLVLSSHTESVTAVAFGELDGRLVLATGSGDGSVRLWDPADGSELRTLSGHTDRVSAVAFGELDGRPVLATGSQDCSVRLWDLQGDPASVLLPLLTPVLGVAVGIDRTVAIAENGGIACVAPGGDER
jgi:hypothetical protein